MRIVEVFAATAAALAACACTVSAGSGDGFTDTDEETDTDFFGDTEETEATETDEGVTEEEMTDETMTEEMTDVPTDEGGTDVMTDDMPTDGMGAGGMGGEMEPDAGSEVCEAFPETECEQCAAQDCTAAFTLCRCDEACSDAFDEMLACYAEGNFAEMPPESEEEYADCLALGGAGDGTLLGDLTACIEATYMGDDDETFRRYAGDGVCTNVCYGLFSVELVE